MKVLYLDCFSGISGDMTLGALLDLGLSFSALETHLALLGLEGYRLRRLPGQDGALTGTRFDVALLDDSEQHAHQDDHSGDSDPHGHHEHVHHHDDGSAPTDPHGHHGHLHPHDHAHTAPGDAGQERHQHRTHAEIQAKIRESSLDDPIKKSASAIFGKLAEAEGKIHGIPPEEVAFHEVGALDSIIDIVGTAIGVHLLGIKKIYCSPLPAGRGMVRCQHGQLPLPAPATLELLKGIPIYDPGRDEEMVTPTGAAIVATLSSGFGGFPSMIPDAIGYGLGARRGSSTPNALRAVVGELDTAPESRLPSQRVAVLETNIDDMNPQLFEPLMTRLLQMGVLDVSLTPTLMKKGRPGIQVQVVCPESLRESAVELLLSETTSLGIRYHTMERACLERKSLEVETPYGPIRIKIGGVGGVAWNIMPEFEDCREAALRNEVPLKVVQQEAIRRALEAGLQGGKPG